VELPARRWQKRETIPMSIVQVAGTALLPSPFDRVTLAFHARLEGTLIGFQIRLIARLLLRKLLLLDCLLLSHRLLLGFPLSADMRHKLLLAAREALQNVATHASATEA
jgi:hypothetical protein